jgi:hypothetical protein
VEIVTLAKMRHAGLSARIERCRSEGVDYERAEAYASVVMALYTGIAPSAQFHVVLDEVTYHVKIVIGNLSANLDVDPAQAGRMCMLCLSSHHTLRLCPHLPDELRPFV